ncbi:MAG: type II secretion system protein GspD [Alphaproteobacteria bacterium]
MLSYVSAFVRPFGVLCPLLVFSLSAFMLSSCDLAANYTKTDRASNMEFQDFRDGLAERLPEPDGEDAALDAAIPELQPYIALASEDMQSMPLVSVSVNQAVPLRDILYELAQQAEYDLELDPHIRGSIIFTARNKPFDVVVHRISNVAGLRYKFEDEFLRVELDKPYVKTYKIDYLSFIRSNSGSVNTSVSVVSGEGADTGSSYASSSDSTSDFWGELETNLAQILGEGSASYLRTDRDPRITAEAQNPDVAAVSPSDVDAQTDGNGNIVVQPPEAVLRVDSLPVDTPSGSSKNGEGSGMSFSVNKQAGLVNVYASEKVHKEVKDYLKELRRSVTAQVLVEAKVFEVSLHDEFINGIDWQVIGGGEGFGSFVTDSGLQHLRNIRSFGIGAVEPLLADGAVAANSSFVTGVVGSDFQALVRAISGFGTVRALASPRLTVLNNQSAVLNVATNRVFFELDVTRERDEETNLETIEIESEIQSVPEGVLINVQPSINLDDRTISMIVRPTITRAVGTVQDPGVQFVAGDTGIMSAIPEVNVQEIDTVIKVGSGQPIVMGGLLQDRISNAQEGVPVLGELPLFGSLFETNSGSVQKTELVIFLKATLINGAHETIHDTDKDLYRTFSGDRRPLKL